MITIRQKMDHEKQNFLIHLNRIKNLYPQVKITDTDDNKQLYDTAQLNIDKSFENLYLLKNELLNKSDNLANNMMTKDEYINTARTINKEHEKRLKVVRNQNYAALPREENIKSNLYNEILYASIQVLFFTGSGYLLYRLLKS